ncbi:MAG: sulfatase [Alphaproteobacteria bacterium]|nr:sulfatase [Alphaproteobacteria bacterium]
MALTASALWGLSAGLSARAALRVDAWVLLPGEAWDTVLPWLGLHLGLAAVCVALAQASRRPALSLAPAALLALLWALWPLPTPPAGPGASAAGPDLLLITLDTFRADHLGTLGAEVGTPHLDALAGEGALFTQAVSAAPLTAPAHASMLTGLPVSEHGLAANGDRLDAPTVVPRLVEAGYRAGAFLAGRVLERRTGLGQGFQHFDDRWTWRARQAEMPGVLALLGAGQGRERRGDLVVERARRWRAAQTGPSFTWVHLYDPHTPYLPPPEWRPGAEARAEAARADAEGRPRPEDARGFLRNLEQGYSHGQRLLYAAEIRWTDHLVGELLKSVSEDTIVIVSGDHGESLTEHGLYFNHGADLFEPSMHVPLILRWPGTVAGGQRHEGLVGIEQIAATLLDAAGVEAGPASLRLALQGAPRGPVAMYSPGQQARAPLERSEATPEQRRVTGLRLEGAKLIAAGEGTPTLYDLRADPEELDALPVPIELSEEQAALMRLREGAPEGLSEAQRGWLEEIGYVD